MTTSELSVENQHRNRRLRRSVLAALPFLVLLIIWESVSLAGVFPPSSLPPPTKILDSLVYLIREEELLQALGWTVYRVFLGGALGLGIGLALGILVALSRKLAAILEPVTSFFQSIGEVGWLPVFILWFGFNDRPIVIVTAYTVMFPVFFGTVSGIGGIPAHLLDSVRTLGGSRRHVLGEVMIPGALPGIMTGFRTGMGFGWRTVILAELLVGDRGLGVLLFQGREFFRPDWIIAEMLVIGCVWLTLDALVLMPVERNTVERWGLVK